jgi:hypothetical protein
MDQFTLGSDLHHVPRPTTVWTRTILEHPIQGDQCHARSKNKTKQSSETQINPICFAQSPPLLTYIGEPKGEALHLSTESSIFGSFHSFNFFWSGPFKFNKKNLDL